VIMGLKGLRSNKWFKCFTNTYILVLTLFVVWMAFFDTNSLMIHLELRKEVRKLKRQKEFLQQEIQKDQEILEKMSDGNELERLAREKYYMKKEKEEIFLIEYQDSLKQDDE